MFRKRFRLVVALLLAVLVLVVSSGALAGQQYKAALPLVYGGPRPPTATPGPYEQGECSHGTHLEIAEGVDGFLVTADACVLFVPSVKGEYVISTRVVIIAYASVDILIGDPLVVWSCPFRGDPSEEAQKRLAEMPGAILVTVHKDGRVTGLPTPTPSITPTSRATNTVAPTKTRTPVPTGTPIPPTITRTATRTNTPTRTSVPTNTPAPTATPGEFDCAQSRDRIEFPHEGATSAWATFDPLGDGGNVCISGDTWIQEHGWYRVVVVTNGVTFWVEPSSGTVASSSCYSNADLSAKGASLAESMRPCYLLEIDSAGIHETEYPELTE